MEEIWKNIEGYPNYQISSIGRVKSLERNIVKGRGGLYKIEEKILKGGKDGKGYLFVHLYKNRKQKNYYIHRLVASAFLDNPNNLLEVNHKDEDKTNNQLTNLEWCTSQYNNNYGTRNERIQKTILQFSLDCEFIRKWDSATQVRKEMGFIQGNISSCCKGRLKSAYGYKWGYADDYERIPFKVFDLEIYEKKVA